jgi:hypothetical protein
VVEVKWRALGLLQKQKAHRYDQIPGKPVGYQLKFNFQFWLNTNPLGRLMGWFSCYPDGLVDQFSTTKKRKANNSLKNGRKENWEAIT